MNFAKNNEKYENFRENEIDIFVEGEVKDCKAKQPLHFRPPGPEDPYVFGPPRSVSQRYGSEDPHLDPYQNVMDPQHCLQPWIN